MKRRQPRRKWVVIGLLIVLGLAAFLWDENRDDHRAARERQKLAVIGRDAADAARDAKAALDALTAAIAQGPAAQEEAIDELTRRFEEAQRRQTQVIIREQRARPQTIVVYVTPSPQPTATVTCNPTPVVGNCSRGNPRGMP